MATPWLHVPTFRIAIPPSDLYYTCTGGWRRMRDRTPSSCESMCSCQSFHVRVRRVSMYTLKGRMCKKGTWKFLSPCVSRAQKRRGKFWLNKYSPSFFSCQIYFHRTLEINLLVKIRKPVGRDSFLKRIPLFRSRISLWLRVSLLVRLNTHRSNS